MDQYFTREPSSESRPVICEFEDRGRKYVFETDAGVFSRGEVDQGTEILLKALPDLDGDILDLGCGWGVVGTCLKGRNPDARIVMVDVNLRALELSRKNLSRNGASAEVLESDGFEGIRDRTFDAVVTNPPIRAGQEKVYEMLGDAARSLKSGGQLFVVIRKQQGAESCMRYLKTLFDEVEKIDRSAGYWVLQARERKQEG